MGKKIKTEKRTEPLPRTEPCPDRIVIQSHGMGVESQAILERWVAEPESRPFVTWDQLIVVTAQVGEEHKKDTIRDCEARMLPLLRQHGVRFVELARRGFLEEDGIVVLQDTRQPEKLHPDGVFSLSQYLMRSGTVPQFGGEHRCALKFKAYVIETWLNLEFQHLEEGAPVYHVFGYNADEVTRTDKSEYHIQRHNADKLIPAPKTPLMVFGFNSEEIGRVERSMLYDGPSRTGHYPLDEWGWTRAKCIGYILQQSGIVWRKSACSFCLTGDTEVITRDGTKPIRELAGTSPELLIPTRNGHYKDGTHGDRKVQSRGTWRAAPIRSFGVQPVVELKLLRRRTEMIVKCTQEHRWFLLSGAEVTAADLAAGDRLMDCRRPSIHSSGTAVTPSAMAIAQGFTFGDGTRNTADRYAAYTPFYAEKDQSMLPYFANCRMDVINLNGGPVKVALDLPRYWKDLPPLRESRSFLLGWLAGYFAADGDVVKKGNQATLCSSVRENLLFARDVCYTLGIETSSIRERKNENRYPNALPLWSMSFRVSDVPESFWLIEEHRRRVEGRSKDQQERIPWRVEAITPAGVEEVFCATVPDVGMFTLVNNLVTGNCPFCAEASKGEPDAVRRWEESPEDTAKGMLVEYNSLCFNPRGHLYRDRALQDVVNRIGVTAVQEAFQRRLDDAQWSVYRVRRIYTKKGKAMRYVEKLTPNQTRSFAESSLRGVVARDAPDSTLETKRGIDYHMFAHREEDVYPTREGYYVVAPAFMEDKLRGKPEKFNERWERVGKGLPMNPTPAIDV
jgi:hypothetical protein